MAAPSNSQLTTHNSQFTTHNSQFTTHNSQFTHLLLSHCLTLLHSHQLHRSDEEDDREDPLQFLVFKMAGAKV